MQNDVYIKMRSVGKRGQVIVEKEQFHFDNMLLFQVGFITRIEFVR